MENTLDGIRDVQIYQSKNGYRFSIDALLLFSFVDIPIVNTIGDLGAGSGIIGLLLAKKYPAARVSLFELQRSLSAIARKNVALNCLDERVHVVNSDIRTIRENHPANSFDVVVSNPPFRKPRSGFISPEPEKAVARHEIELMLPELIVAAAHLLRSKGRLFLIHHPDRLAELIRVLQESRLEMKRLRFVHSKVSSAAKMVLIEAAKDGRQGLKVENPLFVYNEDGSYSDEVFRICYEGGHTP